MRSFVPLVILFFVLAGPFARADTTPGPGTLAATAEALLDAGRVEEAARAFADAARQTPGDEALAARAMVLRRVVSLRRFVQEKPDAPQWATAAVTLQSFYLAEDLPAEALVLAKRAHARSPDARGALMLAEAHLALGQDQEAAALLAARPEPTGHERILNGIAVARLGHVDAARGLVSGVQLGPDAHPVLLQDAARLRVLLGTPQEAYALLRRSFETTPPPALDAARSRVRRSPDFAAVRDAVAFRQVLQTASKVVQTCSGGTSCATCPNRGGCGSK